MRWRWRCGTWGLRRLRLRFRPSAPGFLGQANSIPPRLDFLQCHRQIHSSTLYTPIKNEGTRPEAALEGRGALEQTGITQII